MARGIQKGSRNKRRVGSSFGAPVGLRNVETGARHYFSHTGARVTASAKTTKGRQTRRSISRAGTRGAFLGAAAGTAVLPGIGTGVGAVLGANRATNVRIEKLANQNLHNTTGKNKNTKGSTTKAHAGQVGRTGSTGNRSAAAKKAAATRARSGRGNRTKRDSHGRYAGSY